MGINGITLPGTACRLHHCGRMCHISRLCRSASAENVCKCGQFFSAPLSPFYRHLFVETFVNIVNFHFLISKNKLYEKRRQFRGARERSRSELKFSQTSFAVILSKPDGIPESEIGRSARALFQTRNCDFINSMKESRFDALLGEF